MTPEYSIPLKCDMLVDQNRKIGGDEVGYACWKPAKWEHPTGYLFCEECLALFMMNPARITLPSIYGKEVQLAILQKILKY